MLSSQKSLAKHKTVIIISIFMILIILGASVYAYLQLTNNSKETSKPTPTPTPQPTSIPTITTAPTVQPEVLVYFYTNPAGPTVNITRIPGYDYLIVTLTIINHGYPSFPASSPLFEFRDSDGYTYSGVPSVFTKYNLDHSFNVNIPNGGNYTGTILSPVHTGESIIGLDYSQGNYNVVGIIQAGQI